MIQDISVEVERLRELSEINVSIIKGNFYGEKDTTACIKEITEVKFPIIALDGKIQLI